MPPSAATDDDSSLPQNNRKRKAEVLLPEALLLARDGRGECPTCGTRVREEQGEDSKWMPVTRPGSVVNGRCLYCYPDRGMEADTLVPSEISVTGAAGQEAAAAEAEVDDEDGTNSNHDDGSPVTTKLNDSYGGEYVGLVTEGTAEKGRGVFSHVHKDGELEGKAHMYEGEFEDGFFEGRGTLRAADGSVYEGEFKKSMGHGHGKVTLPDGKSYEGEIKNNKCNGRGTMKWSNGERYEGEVKDNLKHGKGKYFWANGDVFEGNWTNGKRHGQGEKRYADGRIKKGEWKEGKFLG